MCGCAGNLAIIPCMGACRHRQGGTCPLENVKAVDMLQLQHFGSYKKTKIIDTRNVSQAQNVRKCVCGRDSAPDPAGTPLQGRSCACSAPQVPWLNLRGRFAVGEEGRIDKQEEKRREVWMGKEGVEERGGGLHFAEVHAGTHKHMDSASGNCSVRLLWPWLS